MYIFCTHSAREQSLLADWLITAPICFGVVAAPGFSARLPSLHENNKLKRGCQIFHYMQHIVPLFQYNSLNLINWNCSAFIFMTNRSYLSWMRLIAQLIISICDRAAKTVCALLSGLHAEGSTVNSLFGLLLWRILYNSPVADAFRLLHQSTPLDLDYQHFYTSRQQAIDDRCSVWRDGSCHK